MEAVIDHMTVGYECTYLMKEREACYDPCDAEIVAEGTPVEKLLNCSLEHF